MIEENEHYKDLNGNVYHVISIEKMDDYNRQDSKESMKVQVVCTEGPHEGKVRFVGLKLMKNMIENGGLVKQ